MGLLRDQGRNIAVASVNGYKKENVIKAKRYLREIGQNRRNFPIERLVEIYNDVKETNDKPTSCTPCSMTKYYNGIQNYAYFGELTLINNGKATKEELDLDLIDAAQRQEAEKEQDTETPEDEITEEERKKAEMKERMAKLRAAKAAKAKKKEENG